MSENAPIPPQNLDAEESVCGAMMLSPTAIESVIDTGLRPDDFYRESLGRVFRTAVEMYDSSEPVDAITLADRMLATGRIKTDEEVAQIHELAALVPAASNASHYAKIVADTAVLRRLIDAGAKIAKLGWDREGTTQELISKAEIALTDAVRNADTKQAEDFIEELDVLLDELREAFRTKVPIFGKKTGFTELDTMLSGLWAGQLILIAARPGNGKSACAQNIAENFVDRKEAVLLVSLEMSKRELQLRSLARASKVDSRVLGTGQMTVEQAAKMKEALPEVQARKGYMRILDDGGATVSAIRSEARRMARSQNGLHLIIVDYLQLMGGAEGNNRNDQISVISRNLKLLARELDIPVIALSQMNREVIHRSGNRPQLSDLRDSGSLEQDADVVIFLHSESDYDSNKEPDGTIDLIVAKNRRGAGGGTVTMGYNRAWNRFGDVRKKENDESA